MDKQTIVMYTKAWCGDCQRAKQFFLDYEIEYEEIDVDADEEAAAFVRSVNNGRETVPTIVFTDQSILVEPSNKQLAHKMRVELNPW